MSKIHIRGGKADNPTVAVLTQHLTGLGHEVDRSGLKPFDVVVSWGLSYHGDRPSLNGNVNQFDKHAAFERFNSAGVQCPLTVSMSDAMRLGGLNPPLPWLARKVSHVKGKDIKVCINWRQVEDVIHSRKHDFFSVFIPTETEFRVWVFQDKAFAIQEKVYKGPGEYAVFLRNNRFGFKFEKRDNLRGNNELLNTHSIAAVKALGLDFGAVDVLLGKDGRYYVLEVNTMPAIDSVKRSSGVRLAKHISKWAEAL